MANPGSQEAALLAQKKQASNTWMLLDTNGHKTLLEVDKHAIMYRVGIHARDLRILDPLLSYPSTILGRERAIVLNLEHIKAIITAEEVLLRDPMHESVVPLVEEFQKRLPGGGRDNLGQERSEGHNDDYIPGSDGSPFEFRALEVALQAICSFLYARTTELEKDAYPALDELTIKISSQNLDRVRKLKSSMTRLNARVQKVKDELEQLLHDDDDMADLFLTRKMLGAPSSLPNSGVLNWAPPAATIVSTKVSDDDDVDELEMLLEAYFTQIDGILHKLTSLREYIDDTEDYINMQMTVRTKNKLDNHRNKLIQLELILNVANIVMAVFSLVTAIFGMNIPFSWNLEHPEAFTGVVGLTSITCLVGFISVLGYARYQRLIGD